MNISKNDLTIFQYQIVNELASFLQESNFTQKFIEGNVIF